MSDKSLEFAEQQLLGFAHAQSGYSARDLVESMGLTKSEWSALQEAGNTHVSEIEQREIGDYLGIS